MARLRRVRQTMPGYGRRRAGRGFVYLDEHGRRIEDEEVLVRIRGLAIPPAWEDVWICPDPRGHLQAVGTDRAGRLQYRYHDAWRIRQDRRKFERIEGFAESLPVLRARVVHDLGRRGLPRERVLACGVRLLDRGFFRIGGQDYAVRNGSFGLTTIRKDHVVVGANRARFDFVAKGGKRRRLEISDEDLLPVLRSLRRRRNGGEELLAWREGDAWRDVRADDLNQYLKEATGNDQVSAKDFRTWHATVLAAVRLAEHGALDGDRASNRVIAAVIREVSENLGNTPAVCRASYVDPRILDRYREGDVITLSAVSSVGTQSEIESAVLDLLRSRGEGANRERLRRAA